MSAQGDCADSDVIVLYTVIRDWTCFSMRRAAQTVPFNLLGYYLHSAFRPRMRSAFGIQAPWFTSGLSSEKKQCRRPIFSLFSVTGTDVIDQPNSFTIVSFTNGTKLPRGSPVQNGVL